MHAADELVPKFVPLSHASECMRPPISKLAVCTKYSKIAIGPPLALDEEDHSRNRTKRREHTTIAKMMAPFALSHTTHDSLHCRYPSAQWPHRVLDTELRRG